MVSKYFLPHDDTDDNYDLWDKFPNHRWIHNKLELALLCGHNAGPIPILPKASGYYILRPIYNLIGLGLKILAALLPFLGMQFKSFLACP